MGLFGKSNKQRRNSIDERDNTQYWTPRGTIPAKVIDAQVAEAGDLLRRRAGRYAHEYENEEINGPPFHTYEYERQSKDKRTLMELPVATRFNFDQPPAPLKKVQNRERPLNPGDRARVVQNGLNDPGPFRAVVPTEKDSGRTYGVAGVLYHPEGRTRDFERAPVEQMDRYGRQVLRRYQDNSYGNRSETWPPRDEDAENLRRYEAQYKQVRKPKRK